MESKKINQLATEVAPVGTDLTIIGDPITGVSKKITLIQLATTIGAAADLQQVTNNGATTTNPIEIGGLTITGLATGVLKSDSGVISSVPYGAANGVATLGGDGKVPSSQLPSYVDDVIEVANYAALPVTGETGVLYITLDTNRIYRWTGSTYVEIVDTTAVWGAITGTLSNQTDLQNALNLKANDNAVVHLAGTETISGAKTFSNPITISTASYLTSRLKLNNTELAGNNWSISSGNANNSTNNALFTIINETSSTNTFVLSPTGKLAIGGDLGTTNPADDLGIFSTNTNLKIFDITGNGSALNLQATNTSSSISAAYFTTAIPLVLRTGNTDRLTIAANGNSTFANDLTINGSTTGTTGSFASSGGSDTFAINHSSGSGIALNITKAGDGEGIYVNKTSGSGNAATIIGTLNATTLVKDGGTSSQFLMADGSVNTSVLPSGAYLPLSGGTLTGALSGTSATFTSSGTLGTQIQLAGTTDSAGIKFTPLTGNSWEIQANTSSQFFVYNRTNSFYALTIASTGAATFSSSVTAGGATAIADSLLPIQINAGASSQAYFASNNNGGYGLLMGYDNANGYARIRNVSNTALTFETNNTEKMRITNGGNLGIGTSSPSALLTLGSGYSVEMNINSSTPRINLIDNSVYTGEFKSNGGLVTLANSSNNPIAFATNGSERMRITSVGNVEISNGSIGNGSGDRTLQMFGSSSISNNDSAAIHLSQVWNGISYRSIISAQVDPAQGAASSCLVFKTAFFNGTTAQSAERMRLTTNGSLLIGTTDAAARLVVRGESTSGNDFAVWVTDSVGSLAFAVRNDTLIRTPGTYSYAYASTANVFVQSDGYLGRNTSSLKYKKNVEDYTRGLTDVLKLRPVLYESKNPSEADKKFTGFIAEEIHDLGLTEFVQYANDGTPDALQYPHFVALLAKAIQELNEKIKQLENK